MEKFESNLNGGELERIEAKRERPGGRPTHRFEPSVFRVLTTFVEFHYRTLEPKQLEPKATECVILSETVILEHQYTGSSSFQSHTDNQFQYPPRSEHDEFCRDTNRAPVPRF